MSTERIVPAPTDPMAVARAFIAENYVGIGGTLLLRHHRNGFYCYAGDHWPEDDERRVTSELWQWLEDAQYERLVKEEIVLVPFDPNKYKIANVLEALKAIGHVAEGVQPPSWLEGAKATPINAGEIVPLANGILEFSTRKLRQHTPELFEQHVLPFAYDPKAPTPARWLHFLDELWEDDEESKHALAEWYGYVLSNDTSQQKIELLVGPRRSGKGTIARVLTGLLGGHNVAAPTLAGLATNFGLQPLIGKPLAIVSDARLGSRSDSSIAVERLLSISGEDVLTIDRKYREPWTGRLPTRFMILTNELPKLKDSSGALAGRFVMQVLTRSFYGRENPALTNELLEHSAGIFNWALEGLDHLRERGHFLIPPSAEDALRNLEDLASPVGAFVRDLCEVGPACEVPKDDLWAAWKAWCTNEGRDRPGTKAVFGRDLHATVAGLKSARPREGEERTHLWRGLKLSQQSSVPLTTLTRTERTPLVRDPTMAGFRSTMRVVRDGQGSHQLLVQLCSSSADPFTAQDTTSRPQSRSSRQGSRTSPAAVTSRWIHPDRPRGGAAEALGVSDWLHEAVAQAPLVLSDEHAAELGKGWRAILEAAQDELALLDCQRDRCSSGLEAIAEGARRGLVDEASQLADDLGRDGETGEHRHEGERTYVRCRVQDRRTEERSRPGRVGLRSPIPLSPEEEIRGRPGVRISHRHEMAMP